MLQRHTFVVPQLDKPRKEGEVGQQKITQYTRYLTVALAFGQSIGYVFLFRTFSSGSADVVENFTFGRVFVIVMTLTAGCVLLMWLGELITQRGIGNRIPLIIFASLAPPARDHRLVDEPGPDLRRDDALPGCRGDRRDRVHAGGPAPHPGPVCEARGGPPDGRRRLHLP